MASTDTGISIGGLVSGLDTNSIIDGLVAIEQSRVTKLETTQESFNVSISAWGSLVTNLNTLQAKGRELSDPDNFDKFSITSSNEDILTIEGKDGGNPGSFAISVFQTAKSEKIMSKTYASQLTALAISGEFKVKPTQAYLEDNPTAEDIAITVDADDSLKDIMNKINGAANIGVSASIVKLSSTEYAMILTSKDTGAAGATYTESSGTVLQDLGILNASGQKGNVATKLQSAANTSGGADITATTLFSAIDGANIGTNDTITIRGVDRNGNELAARNFVVSDPATQTVDDLLNEIESAFNGMVTATVENGRIMVTDKTDGKSALQVEITANNESAGSALNLSGLLSVNTAGKNGVLQVGQDAFYSVDNLFLTSASNEADDAIQGVTIKMKKADVSETVIASIERDKTGVQANVQAFVDSLNLTLKYITESTKVKVTVNKSESSSSSSDKVSQGPLAGDSTVSRLKSELINLVNRQHEELVGVPYTSLSSIGIGSDPYTGEFKIDEDKFQAALDRNYENVKQLFVKTGTSENANFTFGLSTEDTSSGRYKLDVDAKTISQLDRYDAVVNTWNASVSGNVFSVTEEGAAKGLSVTVPDTGSAIFTFSKGLGLDFADYIKKATDTYDGFITLKTQGLENRVKEYDTRIEEQQRRVDDYEAKLKAQFSALEQTMARLKSQNSQMMAALG